MSIYKKIISLETYSCYFQGKGKDDIKKISTADWPRLFNVKFTNEIIVQDWEQEAIYRELNIRKIKPVNDLKKVLDRKGLRDILKNLVYIKYINAQKGFGLFAKRNLPAGTRLGHYSGELQYDNGDHEYSVQYPKKNLITNARCTGNHTRFINSSEPDKQRPNVLGLYLFAGNIQISEIYSTKDIKAGEEFLIRYGERYWQNNISFVLR